MIHHLSIPAKDPLHVAKIMTELFGGVLTDFGPYKNSYMVWMRDEYGTAIEIYPAGTEMLPDANQEMLPDANQGQANFRHNPNASAFIATHAAISINREKEEIFALASREGWRAIQLSRGSFDVIEFWIENSVMLELLTPEMANDYLRVARAGA